MFKNSVHNYITTINGGVSDSEIESYFVGTWFNVGVYPAESMQQCVGVEIH